MSTKLNITKVEPGGSPIYGREISGRCHPCNSRFLWSAKLGRLKDMPCPFCGTGLQATTHLFKGDTYWLMEP